MKLCDFDLRVAYEADGAVTVTELGDEVVSVVREESEDALHIRLFAKKRVKLVSARLITMRKLGGDERFFGAGYQSWTTTREYAPSDRQRGLRNVANLPFVRTFAAPTGDYGFVRYARGVFHSHGYTYIRHGDDMEFFGSLDETGGFTVFYADVKEGFFAITKDVEGAEFEGEYPLFDLVRYEGGYDEVFDKYFAAYPVKRGGGFPRLTGYTSWYNYFQKIDEKIILRDLDGLFSVAGDKANIFQIDDGYESRVGDWLAVDPVKFPRGMKVIADAVHEKGYLAGIWLAPFAAEFRSALVADHPDWLLKDEKGKPVVGGFAWNGFYVLDHENPEVRAYIKKVFDVVFDEWGFDMVKLDFLYAACILPRGGKTRGKLMHEAMAFLRECVRDKLLLGCGVPMTSSFGFVDACRISCDVELSFADRYYVSCTNQEIISAKGAINNSVFRRHLDGRAFACDPDVFFLRDGGMKPTDYTEEQKRLLARVNRMFGSVLFVSDNAGDYNDAQRELLLETFRPFEGKILRAERVKKHIIRVDFVEDGVEKAFTFDLRNGEYTVRAVK